MGGYKVRNVCAHTHTHKNIFKAKSHCCFLGMPSIISHLVCVLCVYTQEGNLSHWSDVSNRTDYSEQWRKRFFFLTPPPPLCEYIRVYVCVCTQVGFNSGRCECFEHPLAQCGVWAKPPTETKRPPANLRRHSCIQKWIIKGIHMR